MKKTVPTIYLFAGSNGSGKTTFARAYLPQVAGTVRFLNADEIARGLSPFAPEKVAFKAGRLLLREVAECLGREESFGLESTLSGLTYIHLLREALEAGYGLELHYLWVPSVELAIRRVRQRVQKGGHSVPEPDIRRRYRKSVEHLLSAYLPLASQWFVWDNENSVPKLLAHSGKNDILETASLLGCPQK